VVYPAEDLNFDRRVAVAIKTLNALEGWDRVLRGDYDDEMLFDRRFYLLYLLNYSGFGIHDQRVGVGLVAGPPPLTVVLSPATY